VLAGVPDIDDLYGASKMLIGDVPDPLGTVAQYNFLLGPVPTPLPSFSLEARAKKFGGFDCPGVGGGSGGE
jgi:hypothetical protein